MATVLPTSSIAAVEPQVPSAVMESATPSNPLEQRVVLYNVSWETYERLVEEIQNPGTRLIYDEGVLEIVSPRETHDRFKELLGSLLEVLTEELNMPRRSTGQTTWRRKAKKKGIEADKSYYLTSAPKVLGKREVDLSKDPPPDLAIEVENTTSSVDQLAIYAALGVAEVWRYDGEHLTIHALQSNGQYAEQAASRYFPKVAIDKAVEWLGKCDELDETAWVKEFRRWVRENLVQPR
jgi:Uma2 family endonuclease